MKPRTDEKLREEALRRWDTCQIVFGVWIVLMFLIPFLYGWKQSLLQYLQGLVITITTVALMIEIMRTILNRQVSENLCKWIWQK